jgi:dihydroorotate dehydrogenase (fumarate)
VKLSPFFTAFGSLARELDAAGAAALVLFNRFYQPDIDIRTMTVTPQAQLSNSGELLLRLRWLAIRGGVVTPEDGIKAILAGADVVQMVSALLRHGPSFVGSMHQALERWMAWQKIDRLADARGILSLRATEDRGSFERAQYIRTLHSWTA